MSSKAELVCVVVLMLIVAVSVGGHIFLKKKHDDNPLLNKDPYTPW